MPELITTSLAEYETLALDLARCPDRLAAIKNKLQINHSSAPLFDAPRLTRHLEAAYVHMWRLWEKGLPDEAFRVEPLN
jgi:predicted O-linked N-acetylglucosamine transferase (SPINDLY family)